MRVVEEQVEASHAPLLAHPLPCGRDRTYESLRRLAALMVRLPLTTLRTTAVHVGEASAPGRFAAEELRRYLESITGVALPIIHDLPRDHETLIVGTLTVPPTPPRPEGFRISPETKRITLSAASPRLLLDAVYALLEQLGCRWSLHGTEAEVVPRLAGDTLGLAPIEAAPPFRLRGDTSDFITWHYTHLPIIHTFFAAAALAG